MKNVGHTNYWWKYYQNEKYRNLSLRTWNTEEVKSLKIEAIFISSQQMLFCCYFTSKQSDIFQCEILEEGWTSSTLLIELLQEHLEFNIEMHFF